MENIDTSSESKIRRYDFILLWSNVAWCLPFPHYRKRNLVFPIYRRAIMFIFGIRNIIEFRHDWVLFTVRFVVNWLVDFSTVCIIIKRIYFFPVKSQNITWWFLVLFVFLSWTITNQIVYWFCHPWTCVLLLLLSKHSSEKL